MRRLSRALLFGSIAICALALVACSSGSDGMTAPSGQGQVQILLSSSGAAPTPASAAPTPDGSSRGGGTSGGGSNGGGSDASLQSAKATFASILARTLEGRLIEVTISLPAQVDLLSLGSGREVTLPIGFLPPGTYDQLVVVITKLELTLADGSVRTLTPPGGGWTSIVRVADPFTVVEGATTTITLSLRRDLAFVLRGRRWDFEPRFECHGGSGGDGN